ncbi:MAG: response regulator [Pedosphaera sp.]|nr:response regulator [Pedosphaera sp.]
MPWFPNMSIRKKLVIGVSLICAASLLLTGAAILTYEVIAFRSGAIKEISTLADVVGAYSTGGVEFNSVADAEKTLACIQADSRVEFVGIHGMDGSTLARFSRSGDEKIENLEVNSAAVRFEHCCLHVIRKVPKNDRGIGFVYIRANLSAMRERLAWHGLVVLGVSLGVLALTCWGATGFARFMTAPVLKLVATAQSVGAKHDYSLRCQKDRDDELGMLVNEFNRMLDRIQTQDGELRLAQDQLERRVQERTADLTRQIYVREEVQSRLRKQEEFMRVILETAPSMISVKDSEGRYLLVNRAVVDFHGIGTDDLLGLCEADIRPGDAECEACLKDDIEISQSGREQHAIEHQRMDGRGQARWLQTFKRSLVTAEGSRQILCVSTDITSLKKAETEMQRAKESAELANQAKSGFLANMSHEIRTPMNGILGMANLLLDTKLTDEQRDFTRTVCSSSEALLTILSDILDFSKIEAGKLTFERIPFDLREVVESTAELLAARALEKKIELSCLIANDVKCYVMGDPTRFRQVLLNLIGNAIKFTDRGEVTVSVSAGSNGEGELRFEIRDTGIGISAEALSKLFQAFAQADGSTTRKYGGTGLGLVICKQLVELMGGRIGVESEIGKGSNFWFTASLCAVDMPEEMSVVAALPKGLRVLVVDDNETNRKILHHYLAGIGLTSFGVGDGDAALRELHRAQGSGEGYDLAVLDVQMPGMDGVTLAKLIRGDGVIGRTRLMFLTSLGLDVTAEISSEFGIPCLNKPVKRDVLCRTLAHLWLPVAKSIETTGSTATSASDAGMSVDQKRSVTVLIAEDNLVNQRVAMRLLRKLGFEADIVSDGNQAVAATEQKRYDLILMDCHMPKLDGYEASRAIRQIEAGRTGDSSRHVIIAMTANAMQGDREKCLAAGMDDYVSKPVEVEELRRVIFRQLEARAAA